MGESLGTVKEVAVWGKKDRGSMTRSKSEGGKHMIFMLILQLVEMRCGQFMHLLT